MRIEVGKRSTLILVACLLATLLATPLVAAEKKSGEVQVMDLNQATAEQLQALPGVGPSISRRIVEFRDRQGPFERVEDLMRVKGIGEKTFLKLKPYLKVGKGKS